MNNEEQLHEICHFMSQERLLTLSAAAEGQVWSASCFYHFQQDEMTMYVMSDITTRHASLMLKAPEVSGTITGSDISLMQLKGLQYQAVASLLSTEQEGIARARYYQRYPLSRVMARPMWSLKLIEIKFMQNRLGMKRCMRWHCSTRPEREL
ncbi:hypothetical protein M9782_10910 [Pectobacterium actinidiae]|uniref:Uncharacterized protein n=1 Tax=Pectobacterium actinidiae TaxID=1507808 RepID=A0ABW8G9G2_9GAMM|nr:hypothetical protein [Pectobacterium actinidiae]QDX97830.1 hypothetical protein EGD00_13120 [Pectobacterium carotovorum subsp. carotovorum]WEF09760.1 hypothetical protein M9782_10910 [Pectobacterium actinidiae]GKW15448.1 hypothetical protein PEC301937_13970 [Pectobacterium carotovorum subsp. carotovorum]GLW39208.1 hypothetical protein Pcaca04_31440 [Pectobacterium carotovorum subsp. carotovorum]